MFRRILSMCLLSAGLAVLTTGCRCIDGSVGACGGPACGKPSPCGGCGDVGCGGCGPIQGPLDHFRVGKRSGCRGCGEVYWGEWMSNPPYCCDPCDDHGNWVGHGGCCPQWLRRGWSSLWGMRYGDEQRSDCGCSSCGGKGEVIHEGEIIYEGPVQHGAQKGPLTPTKSVLGKHTARQYYTPTDRLKSVRAR